MSAPPGYAEFAAGPALADLVECFWMATAPAPLPAPVEHRVLPDGCMDLIFDFRAAGDARATVIGAMTRPLVFASADPADLLGVRFRPGGLPPLVALDADRLTDGQADLAQFWGPWTQSLWHRLGEAGPSVRLRLLRDALVARRHDRPMPSDPFVAHCVDRLRASAGTLRLSDLVRSTGLGARQLERKFSRHLGLSPKTFARVVRFQHLTASAARSPAPDWARLAADCGFADQPHLVREFKALAGVTPTAYFSPPVRAAS